MAIPATQMRPGMIIKHNGELHSVFKVEHRTPGNLRAFIQAKLRNLRTGAMYEHRFRSPDPIERVIVDEIAMEFLYADGEDAHFMDSESYENFTLQKDVIGDPADFLKDGMKIAVQFHDGVPIGADLPAHVELRVEETDPGFKGDTATGTTKPAKLETGATVNVPLFVNPGDVIRIDTRDRRYIGRVQS